ncbi:MAG: hypothetical protein H6707_19145 [Deltaproteobacteria bacterium]|nr:hypothetical protein [Deltaproteobacteria bacterium]
MSAIRPTERFGTGLVLIALFSACGDRQAFFTPLGLSVDRGGPAVIWEPTAKPLPEIPFPNDLATRLDPSSPTGLRVLISLDGALSEYERRARRVANELEGFSTFGTISVSFDKPLDLETIAKRHQDNERFDDDLVLLVDVDPASPDYGQFVALDFGRGNYPEALPRLDLYWPRDGRANADSLLFDPTDEDANQNGLLDPGEDTDGDGYLDRPNTVSGKASEPLVNYYERVTNTLLMRPVVPLRGKTRYAVVLRRGLVGENGQAIHSPFAEVNYRPQSEALAPLREILPARGIAVDDVAFSWTFTTMDPTGDLIALRAGLYGEGPYARLAQQFPAKITAKVVSTAAGANPYLLPTSELQRIIFDFGSLINAGVLKVTEDSKQAVNDALDNIKYFVIGSVRGPNLREGSAANEQRWQLNRGKGWGSWGEHDIPFLCAIPRQAPDHGPAPVLMYAHGYGSTQVELLGFAGTLARHGFATCAIDGVAHGIKLDDYSDLLRLVLKQKRLGPFFDHIFPGRAEDVDNNNQPDSGANFISADLARSRDNVRQTVLDTIVVVRALRALGQEPATIDYNGDQRPDLDGDFDGDGKLDLGGPTAKLAAWGTSLGGITSTIVGAVEPAIRTIAPQAMGGGLVDIVRRTEQSAAVNSAMLRMLGPLIIGQPTGTAGQAALSFWVATGSNHRVLEIGQVDGLTAGDRVELLNLRQGDRQTAYVDREGGFRVQVAADALDGRDKRALIGDKIGEQPLIHDTLLLGDPLVLRVYAPKADTPKIEVRTFGKTVAFEGLRYAEGSPLVAPSWGFGLPRNSPRLRRMIGLAQLLMDPADPINYVPFLQKWPHPLRTADDPARTNALFIATAGDITVPVATAISLARAAGAVDFEAIDPRYQKNANRVLIDNYITEGLSRLRRHNDQPVVIDPEDFSRGLHAPDVPRLKPPLRLEHRQGDEIVALRIPLLDPLGQHGFLLPDPTAAFDNNTFLIHMVARFLVSQGKHLSDEPCMAQGSCSWIPQQAATTAQRH